MASTILNEGGFNGDWIERQLAHCAKDGVRAAYNYAQYMPERRRMMQAGADILDTVALAHAGVVGARVDGGTTKFPEPSIVTLSTPTGEIP